MDERSNKVKPVIRVLLFIVISVIIIAVLFNASAPKKYNVKVGDVAPEDIVASRAVPDEAATHKRALEQARQVQDVMVRSEDISKQSVKRVESFFDLVDKYRKNLYLKPKADDNKNTETETEDTSRTVPSPAEIDKAASALVAEFQKNENIELDQGSCAGLLNLSESIYRAVKDHTVAISEVVMAGEHDNTSLLVSITSQVNDLVENNPYYKNEYNQINSLLRKLLTANLVYDQEATQAARDAVYQQIINDPILIPSGTKVLSRGEIITTNDYQVLQSLGLIESNEINWPILIGLILLYVVVGFSMWLFFRYYLKIENLKTKDGLFISLLFLITFLISSYVGKLSALLMPVYFMTIVLASYFGFDLALSTSLSLIVLLYPVSKFDGQYLFVTLIGVLVAALISATKTKNKNYAMTILGVTASTFAAAILHSVLLNQSTRLMLYSAGLAALSGFVSSILAIGLAPIIEIFISKVSPTKLISLADANQPLLKRLFMEAPATYQHSMMVANLAEAAAERIGANTLLTRVGAYYHDIGKLWNPQMYTENQNDFNPHSLLRHRESKNIIFKHVSYGQVIARQYGLPDVVIDFIRQHHGTTILQYFYTEACDEAEALGMELPDVSEYKYPGPSPQEKEIAIVMLADTVEAAMKSVRDPKNLQEVESFIRRLIKGKVIQNQLVDSGLSFHELEEITQAFMQVFEGQLHERVEYPDDNRITAAN